MLKNRLQLGAMLLAMLGFAFLPGSLFAQKQNPNRPPSSCASRFRAASNAAACRAANNPNANHPQANVSHPNQGRPANPQTNFNSTNHPGNNAGAAKLNQRQQLGVGSPRPWVDTMRSLSPSDRERVLQSSKAFQNLSPDKQTKIRQQFNQWDRMSPTQQNELRQREDTWRQLTPAQRDHIKNDVLPKMRQMPWDRQQMIKQKLGVLQNMPESARNQRLADPNFTRGMSDDEKSTLQDLSHMHVGSAPDPPSE